jgi:hypothetical protein
MEKHVAENGAENKEQKKLTRFATYNMNYRKFTNLSKLLGSYALSCNTKLPSCGGLSRQYLANTEFPNNKAALPTPDANTAFSSGLYQIFK